MFTSLQDPKDPSKIVYALDSLSMLAFRQGSKNTMQTTIESIEASDHKEGISHLLGTEEVDRVPHSSIVDVVLSRIKPNKINDILFQLFDQSKGILSSSGHSAPI